MSERLLSALKNRVLQLLARFAPGGRGLRVLLHRWRGVHIGDGVWIGYDATIETAYPHLVSIGNGVAIGIGVIIVAHFREMRSVRIEDNAFIGPGVIVLPGVIIGRGTVVAAGSVVTHSLPAMTFCRGNPAEPIARFERTLLECIKLEEFSMNLKPMRSKRTDTK